MEGLFQSNASLQNLKSGLYSRLACCWSRPKTLRRTTWTGEQTMWVRHAFWTLPRRHTDIAKNVPCHFTFWHMTRVAIASDFHEQHRYFAPRLNAKEWRTSFWQDGRARFIAHARAVAKLWWIFPSRRLQPGHRYAALHGLPDAQPALRLWHDEGRWQLSTSQWIMTYGQWRSRETQTEATEHRQLRLVIWLSIFIFICGF